MATRSQAHSAGDIILLTGAPHEDSLDWSEESLTEGFGHAFQRYLEWNPTIVSTPSEPSTSSPAWPQWRVVPTERIILETEATDAEEKALYQYPDIPAGSLSFLSTMDESGLSSFSEEHSAKLQDDAGTSFLSASLALDEELRSSQLIDKRESVVRDTSLGDGSGPTCIDRLVPSLASIRLTDLAKLPSASTLRSMLPHRATVNLAVGIIAAQPARSVVVKRTGQAMDIIEMVVGDDTLSGFNVTFWLLPEVSSSSPAATASPREELPSTSSASSTRSSPVQARKQPARAVKVHPEDPLRATLTSIRRGHLLVLRNIALAQFYGRVYAQSLSRRIARQETYVEIAEPVDLLDDPQQLGAGAPATMSPAETKLRRVARWVADFVGTAAQKSRRPPGRTLAAGRDWNIHTADLPADSQSFVS